MLWCHRKVKPLGTYGVVALTSASRNGGHITPPLYHDYSSLKKEFGATVAQRIIRFRLAHLQEFLRVAEEEGLLIDSQARRVQTFDVFFDRETFLQAKAKLEEYSRDMPNEGKVYSALDPVDGVDLAEVYTAILYRYNTDRHLQEYQLSPGAAGCITTTAGAIHPYRLITGILSRLLNEYSDQQVRLSLFSKHITLRPSSIGFTSTLIPLA